MEIRPSGASAAIVQQVPSADTEWFLDWQRGISAAAETLPGYRSTEIYPPADNQGGPWVILVHFDSPSSLQGWLNSPVRAQWISRLSGRANDFEVEAMPVGLGAWFAERARQAAGPPSWKMVVTVVLALFPTVMLLAVFPAPYTAPLGFAASMLIGNFLSVSILQWVVMPVLTRVLRPWLHANSRKDRVFTAGGLAAILSVLVGLVFLFRWAGIGGG